MNQPLKYNNSTGPTLKKFKSNSAFLGNCYAKLSQDQQIILKAIRDGELNVLYKYKNRGMSFDFNDNNPMREAVLSNKLDILIFLYNECGVDLNSESGFAIRWAARKDHLEMVEWLCSLDNIDVTICGGEALAWARENYHFSVQEILEGKIKKYEAERGVTPGATLKQTHQRRYQRAISQPLVPNNTSLITTEFEFARLQASAQRRQNKRPAPRDPSFRVPNSQPDVSLEIGDNSFLLTPQVLKSGKHCPLSTGTSNVSFNQLGRLSSSKSLMR